jgi:hypothetical protein
MYYRDSNPELDAQRAEKAVTDSRSAEAYRKALAAATANFDSAFREWRFGRPEWKALCAAVKREAPESEIVLAAAAAGASANDYVPLKDLRKRALRAGDTEKVLTKATRKFDELERQYRQADAKYPLAKTPFEAEAIADEVAAISEPRQTAMRERDEAGVMAALVREAKSLGLL